MQKLRTLEVGSALLVLAVAFAASKAGAAGIGAPQAPEVFSRDFGIVLAKNYADGASWALEDIENTAGFRFPFADGFEFPTTLPVLREGNEPLDRPSRLGVRYPSNAQGEALGRSPVPEPGTAVLTVLGLTGLGFARRNRSV